jgi:hypothetical protein
MHLKYSINIYIICIILIGTLFCKTHSSILYSILSSQIYYLLLRIPDFIHTLCYYHTSHPVWWLHVKFTSIITTLTTTESSSKTHFDVSSMKNRGFLHNIQHFTLPAVCEVCSMGPSSLYSFLVCYAFINSNPLQHQQNICQYTTFPGQRLSLKKYTSIHFPETITVTLQVWYWHFWHLRLYSMNDGWMKEWVIPNLQDEIKVLMKNPSQCNFVHH